MFRKRNITKRRGAVAAFVAILIPVFFAVLVFAIDYGMLLLARQQLQASADAGALAGVQEISSDPRAAIAAAVTYANENRILGSAPAAEATDVELGRWDTDDATFFRVDPDDGPTAIRVQLRMNEERGNSIRLFFASFFGIDDAPVGAEAIAVLPDNFQCNGFVGLESVLIENNAFTDSYNSTIGSYSSTQQSNGDVCSNGSIALNSGADVFGDVGYGTTISNPSGAGTSISGRARRITTPIIAPPADFDDAELFNDNMSVERGPTYAPPFVTPGGDLVINNGRNITLEAGTYYFRNVTLAGGSQMIINGEVNLFVTNELRFDNGTTANLTQIPANFRINVGQGPVNIKGGHQLHAVIYAPEAEVTVSNGSDFFGSIVGRTLRLAGTIGAHLDESLIDNTSAPSASGVPLIVN